MRLVDVREGKVVRLTTPQLSTMRALVENQEQPTNKRTAGALVRLGFITRASRADGTYEATARGERWTRAYVAQTGDGPEDLKAMFRL